MTGALSWALLVLSLVTASSCLLPPVELAGKRCDAELPCVQGVCHEGVCFGDVSCASDDDCDDGRRCLNGACLTACSDDDDCADGEGCRAGACLSGVQSSDAGKGDADGGSARTDAGDDDAGAPPLDGGDAGHEAGVDAGDDAGGPVDAGVDAGEVVDAGPCGGMDPFGADLTGDCLPDLVVGAPARSLAPGVDGGPSAPVSVVQVFEGRAAGGFTFLFQLTNGDARGELGAAISVDPEPYDESGRRAFVVGEPERFSGGKGRVYWLHPSGSSYAAVLLQGAEDDAEAGAAVAFADGEATQRFAVGLPGAIGTSTTGGLIIVDPAPGAPAATETLQPGDLSAGMSGGPLGAALVTLHDVDGDGLRDLGVSALGAEVAGTPLGAFAVSLREPPFEVVHTWYPPDGSISFAASLASVGDVDGDGVVDVAFGAPHDGDAGRVYLALSSAPDAYVVALPPAGFTAGSQFGAAVSALGDVDGDGLAEVVVGAPFASSDSATPDAACAALEEATQAYAGDCAGSVLVLRGSAIVAAQETAGDVTHGCEKRGNAGDLLGADLKALGPHPTSAAFRVVVGAPRLPSAGGIVRIYRTTMSGDACTLVLDGLLARSPSPEPGDRFGAALGR